MPLTSSQYTALKAAILANADALALPGGVGNNVGVAAIFNAPHATTKLWRSFPVQEALSAIDFAEYETLTVVKQNSFLTLTQAPLLDATQAGIRAALSSIFSGAGQVNSRTALIDLAQRSATLAEDLFKGAQAGVAYLPGSFVGSLSHTDVGEALIKG